MGVMERLAAERGPDGRPTWAAPGENFRAANRARAGRTCGTVSCYQGGCRCEECREAARNAQRRHRARRRKERG